MTLISNIKYSSCSFSRVARIFLVTVLSILLPLSPLISAEPHPERKQIIEKDDSAVELRVPRKKSPSISNLDNSQIQPMNLTPRSSSEFYSTLPDAKILIPIHVWGEVREPGLHFVPLGSNLSEAISASGGPATTAAIPEVNLLRKNEKKREVNLFTHGLTERVAANDTIVVDRSLRTDLPLIFGGISVLISITTLIVLLTKIQR